MTSRFRVRPLVLVLVLLGAGGGGAFAIAWHPAIAPATPPDRAAFAPERIARGAELAAIGDCAVCHTAPGGRPYAGGRAVPTPFGTVHATNITPDPASGIGGWTEAAFRRAMRDGISRDGHHLYPVLPYPHFTRASDDDLEALYAFVMTRAPVGADTPANRLPFPFNQRVTLAGWNLLFLHPGPWQPDPAHDATWNRGNYLVEAVGHCGACHSARNTLGAEHGPALGGGEAENWYAPALQAASPAHAAWDEASLATYLRTGFQANHGAAAGPMTAVTDQLARVPDADVHAIAVYIASLMPRPAAAPAPRDDPAASNDTEAAAVFAGACGSCHAPDAPMTRAGAPALGLSTAVNAPTSQGVVQAILNGIPWRDGRAHPYMPGYAGTLTDAQVAALTNYLRARYSDRPAWNETEAGVAKARQAGAT